MLEGIISDLKMAVTMPCYRTTDRASIIEVVAPKAKQIDDWCKGKAFVAGEHLTYLDFVLYEHSELCDFIWENNKFFTDYPNIKAIHDKVDAIPEIRAFR